MTYEEAYEEIKAEFNEFLVSCHLTTDEQIKAEILKNNDFKVVYEANTLALKSLEILAKENEEEYAPPKRSTGKPVIVTCEDMSNYCICPCCRKPIDVWDNYCKHCGAEMENKE